MAGGVRAGVLRRRQAVGVARSARAARSVDRRAAHVKHEIPLERRTLHGHFSRDLPPVLSIDSGDTVAFSCLDAGWNVEPGRKFEPRSHQLDDGHALIGPIEVRGAKAGQTLEVRIDEVRVGTWGATFAGGWQTPLNDELGVSVGEGVMLSWKLHVEAGYAVDQFGREVELRPFPGVLGMPPPEPGVHSTGPPRASGGTSTARSSSPARGSCCRSRSTERSSPPATVTPARETARCRRRRSSVPLTGSS